MSHQITFVILVAIVLLSAIFARAYSRSSDIGWKVLFLATLIASPFLVYLLSVIRNPESDFSTWTQVLTFWANGYGNLILDLIGVVILAIVIPIVVVLLSPIIFVLIPVAAGEGLVLIWHTDLHFLLCIAIDLLLGIIIFVWVVIFIFAPGNFLMEFFEWVWSCLVRLWKWFEDVVSPYPRKQ